MNADWPKAYKTGRAEFYGREFIVSPDVLIPRPESEAIIEAVLALAGKPTLPGVKPRPARLPKEPRILDIGTGSGCLAITLKLELEDAMVSAVDISAPALKVARENARELGAEVKFDGSDLMDGVPESEHFDVIVANLPYVDRDWEWLESPESAAIKYEPEVALFAEDGGLEVILRLIDSLAESHKETQFLLLEADPVQHARIIKYAAERRFELLETRGFVVVLERAKSK